ncbi:MAG TPA: type II toxin-antitoxin system RelE/ParE family toxin [Candidatus Paceibacterota bacterium]|nr:type II toxin-antitoxin system RelE/ParE family toxin [Candidatus Paceibacterota bacterium]
MYEIFYHKLVVTADIPKLGTVERKRIKKAIELKLTTHPELYGVPLHQSLAGYRKLRVGDYRVVFRIAKKQVLVFIIGHRSMVYEVIEKRI